MLELQKKSLFSNDYLIKENGITLSELSCSSFLSQGSFNINGKNLILKKQGLVKNYFELYNENIPILQISSNSTMWKIELIFKYDNQEYKIVSKAWHSTKLNIIKEDLLIGSIEPKGLLGSNVLINLPNSIPLDIKVFIAWVAIYKWDEIATLGAVA